jgi:hypothetical protein
MIGRMLSSTRTGTPILVRWRNRIAIILACLAILAGATYMTRCALLLNIARIILNRDSGLVAQERADSLAISFAEPPPAWISPMKNQMNDIWDPIKVNGVNYYMFAGPRTWTTSYSHSHSIVAGGLPEMSYTTREIPGTSLTMRCVTPVEKFVRQPRPARRHEIDGLHRTQRNHIVVAPPVAHHADRAHRQEHRERLADLVVQIVRVRSSSMKMHPRGAADRRAIVTSPRMRTPRPGPGKRMPMHHVLRQAQFHMPACAPRP